MCEKLTRSRVYSTSLVRTKHRIPNNERINELSPRLPPALVASLNKLYTNLAVCSLYLLYANTNRAGLCDKHTCFLSFLQPLLTVRAGSVTIGILPDDVLYAYSIRSTGCRSIVGSVLVPTSSSCVPQVAIHFCVAEHSRPKDCLRSPDTHGAPRYLSASPNHYNEHDQYAQSSR